MRNPFVRVQLSPTIKPSIPGVEFANAFVLRELSDGATLKYLLAESAPQRAVIVDAGYIGLEMVETLRKRSLNVSIVARAVSAELEWHGVVVVIETTVRAIARWHGKSGVVAQTNRGAQPAALVLVSVGYAPPFAPGYDTIAIAAAVARKKLAKTQREQQAPTASRSTR